MRSEQRTILAMLFVLLLTGMRGSARADRVVTVVGEENAKPPLAFPFGVVEAKDGGLILAEMEGNRVRRVSPKGKVTILAGTGEKGASGDGGSATNATFNGMHSLALAPNGDLYLADTWNNRVRKIDSNGTITTVVGTGEKGYSGDGGRGTEAKFGAIYCLAFDRKGEHLYMADLDNRRIRVLEMKTGIVRTAAGNGQRGVPTDGGDALQSPLLDPRACAVDPNGNLYILERSGHALRVVDTHGKIRTVVGTGKPVPAADTVAAREATLRGPKHLWADKDGSILIADTDNHVIRRYLPRADKLVRVAGTGQKGSGGVGGDPKQVELNEPHGVYTSASGILYIVDSRNNRLLKIVR